MSPSELCAARVSDAITEKPVSFLSKRGRIAVKVENDHGLTIRFGDKKKPIELGCIDADADFRIECTKVVFTQILDGTIDAERALEGGTLRLFGNLDLLDALIELMERGRSMVSLRAGR